MKLLVFPMLLLHSYLFFKILGLNFFLSGDFKGSKAPGSVQEHGRTFD